MITSLRLRRTLARIAPARSASLDNLLDRTRYGRRLRDRLRAADLRRPPAAHLRLSLGSALAGATVAMLWSGPAAGVAGLLAGAAAPEVSLRRRIATRSARIVAQLPEVVDSLAAPLRAGASLPQAFAAAAEESDPPLRDVLGRTRHDMDAGVPQDEAIGRFASRCGVPEAMLLSRALHVARQAGGDPARVLDEISETLRERERLALELRAATAQARVSATVVAALPVVFLGIMSAGAGEQTRLLFGEPVGWLLLGAGGSLEAAGIMWIRRLTGSVGRRFGGSR